MNNLWDDRIAEEPEAEQIVNNAVNEISNLIKERYKVEFENVQNDYRRLKEKCDSLQKECDSLQKEVNELKTVNERLNAGIEIGGKIIHTDFKIGDEVYRCVFNTQDRISCPLCKGTGFREIVTKDGEKFEVRCKHNGRPCSSKSYNIFIPDKGKIDKITLLYKEDAVVFYYEINGDVYDDQSVFTSYKECNAYCKRKNDREKRKAEEAVGIIIEEKEE